MSEETTSPLPAEPPYALADAEGKTIALISRDVLSRLGHQYEQGYQEKQISGVSQGMLLGSAGESGDAPWTIEKVKPAQGQAGQDPTQSLEQAAQLWEASSVSRLRLVGYYRCTPYLPDTLLPKDLPSWKPLAGAARLMLVTGRGGDGTIQHRAFDLNSGKLLGEIAGGPSKSAQVSSAHSSSLPGPHQERPRNAAVSDRPMTKNLGAWAVVAACIALTAAAAFAYWRSQEERRTPAAVVTAPAPPPSPAPVAAPAIPEKPLGLEVSSERNDGYWRVSWNHAGQAVREAVFGNLRVEDGDRQRDVTLGVEELRTGYVLYQPESDMVVMRLEVLGRDDKRVAEATRIMRSSPNALAQAPPPVAPTPVQSHLSSPPRRVRSVPVKETRRLMIVTVHGPPRVIYMDRPEPPSDRQALATKIPATKPPSSDLPAYAASSRQSQTASRQPASQEQSAQHKKPFMKRVFRFMKRPWSSWRG